MGKNYDPWVDPPWREGASLGDIEDLLQILRAAQRLDPSKKRAKQIALCEQTLGLNAPSRARALRVRHALLIETPEPEPSQAVDAALDDLGELMNALTHQIIALQDYLVGSADQGAQNWVTSLRTSARHVAEAIATVSNEIHEVDR